MINIEDIAYEIDFMPVGTGERSGDAIVLRYGRLNSQTNYSQTVIVIDGGTIESGQKIVNHIKTVYNTNVVDLVINTHPDNDHCSGLREVLNNITVKELWLHTPWNYAEYFVDLFKDGRITDNSLKERLKEGLNTAYELEQIAKKKEILIKEPFSGQSFDSGVIQVLGPSENFYKELLPHFRDMPEPIAESLASKTFAAVKGAINWVAESLDIETLDESGETSPENNSSSITLFSYANKKILFTSDSGIPALKAAIDYAKGKGIDLMSLTGIQVPHHGSKRNISPSVLNQLKSEHAYISCGPDGEPKHPAKKVTNAFKRRNMKSFQTKNKILYAYHNRTLRSGWVPSPEIPFYDKVEE